MPVGDDISIATDFTQEKGENVPATLKTKLPAGSIRLRPADSRPIRRITRASPFAKATGDKTAG